MVFLLIGYWLWPCGVAGVGGGDEDRDGPDFSLPATVDVERGPQALDSTVLIGPGERGCEELKQEARLFGTFGKVL